MKDVHECLELTVYDEDPNKKVEFLGKVAIPLLKVGKIMVLFWRIFHILFGDNIFGFL